ncbi:MAG: asparagine synthase [Thaumarchaeota archaeon]|nr:MAG: asparagine synthase [Nitrososphaerota archaeon]
MKEFTSKLHALVLEAAKKSNSDCISLSGGLDSSILAFCLKNRKIQAIAMVTKDFPSTDLVYAQLVAKLNNLKLDVITATIKDLLDATEQTIKILKVFNPIEIRNSIVVYLTMKSARDNGFKSMITGDGADELFAGYHFFQRLSLSDLQKNLERIWKIMHFPSKSISESLGISLQTPFLDEKIIGYAKKIPPDLKVREEKGKKYGKWILRKAFEDLLPESIIWREKAAMQDGSGTSGLTSFFDNLIPDPVFSEKIKKYVESEKVNLASKESLYYYELYRKHYDFPSHLADTKTRCPQCNYSIEKESHFCRMCGSFPI